jgi:uncharacterized membrane protein YccC
LTLVRLPIAVDLRAISLAEGVRAALAVAVIIAASETLGWPVFREAALAALLTCLCDSGGPIRRRVPALLGFTLAGAAVVGLVGLARGGGLAVALPLGVLGLFCASFIRIYGQAPQQVGALLSVVLILALDRALPDVRSAAIAGASFAGGGLWATLLTMVIWRVHPFLPARRSLAAVYRALALLARDLARILREHHAADEAIWVAHAQTHRNAVRTAIEAARDLVLDTLRARGAASERARHGVIRLEASDQLFGALIGLAELLESGAPLDRSLAVRLLRRLTAILAMFGQAIINDDPTVSQRVGRSIDAMTRELAKLPEHDPLRAIGDRIIERLRMTQTLAAPETYLPGVAIDGTPPPMRRRLLEPLAANLAWRSAALRHAARVSVMAAPALAFTMLWFTPYEHWLTITIVATMQPYFGLTLSRALERVGGTVVGGVVAALVGVVCTSPLAIAAAMFPLAVAALALRAVNFGLFMTALTPLVVLLVEIGQPGSSEWQIAAARAGFTAAGGVLALIGWFALWPSWEPQRLADEACATIAAHARYADAVLSQLLGDVAVQLVDRARRDAGVASNRLEASIARALGEPVAGHGERLEAAMVIDAASRRCAGRLSAIQLDPGMRRAVTTEIWRIWRDWVVASLDRLGAGKVDLAPRPQTTVAIEALARIARQIELMEGAVARMTGQLQPTGEFQATGQLQPN